MASIYLPLQFIYNPLQRVCFLLYVKMALLSMWHSGWACNSLRLSYKVTNSSSPVNKTLPSWLNVTIGWLPLSVFYAVHAMAPVINGLKRANRRWEATTPANVSVTGHWAMVEYTGVLATAFISFSPSLMYATYVKNWAVYRLTRCKCPSNGCRGATITTLLLCVNLTSWIP